MPVKLIRSFKESGRWVYEGRCPVCDEVDSYSNKEWRNGTRSACKRKECLSKVLSDLKVGRSATWLKGRTNHRKVDRKGLRYGKLTAIRDEGNGRWLCLCDCGEESSVLSTNLANMKKNNRGCSKCRSMNNRKDITGERVGLLTAVDCTEDTPKNGPLWNFLCDCGNVIQGTVREFHTENLRSCGCHDNAKASWHFMMKRCYDPDNNRYYCYGARGIVVVKRWHSFDNFIVDMGERPKRHNLSRIHPEKNYSPTNCEWEHITKNTADTCNGIPTKKGLLKGAKPRPKNSMS